MKNTLILCGVLLLAIAQPANAVEVYKSKTLHLDVYGDAAVGVYVGDQDSYLKDDGMEEKPSATQFRADGVFGVDANSILSNGYKVGLLAEIELYSEIETFYIYLTGPFGDVKIGQADNVSSYLHLYHPEFLAPGLATVDWSDFSFQSRNSVNEDNAKQAGDSTFFTYDDIAFQVVYLSPNIQGFTFGVSWTPDPCARAGEEVSTRGQCADDATTYTISDVITTSAQFARKEAFGLAWGLSVSYLTGNRDESTNTPYGYSLGANFGLANFELGGSWQNSRNLNDANVEDRVWTAGIVYNHKPRNANEWRIGTTYRQSRRDSVSEGSREQTRTNRELEAGIAYELGNGLWSSLFLEWVIDKDPREETNRVQSFGGGIILNFAF
jgi:predicted porin